MSKIDKLGYVKKDSRTLAELAGIILTPIISIWKWLPNELRFLGILTAVCVMSGYVYFKRISIDSDNRPYLFPRVLRSAAYIVFLVIPAFSIGTFLQPYLGTLMPDQHPFKNAILSDELYGTYEWQWAGENWYGRVTLSQQNGKNVISNAKVGLIEKIVSENDADMIHMNGMVINLKNGTFDLKNDVLTIDMSVEKLNRRTNTYSLDTIKGELHQTLCYAGPILYSSTNRGDMILVAYPSQTGDTVDDWFRETNPPWAVYDLK